VRIHVLQEIPINEAEEAIQILVEAGLMRFPTRQDTPSMYRFSKPGAVAGFRPSHLSGRGQETGHSAILTGSLNLYLYGVRNT